MYSTLTRYLNCPAPAPPSNFLKAGAKTSRIITVSSSDETMWYLSWMFCKFLWFFRNFSRATSKWPGFFSWRTTHNNRIWEKEWQAWKRLRKVRLLPEGLERVSLLLSTLYLSSVKSFSRGNEVFIVKIYQNLIKTWTHISHVNHNFLEEERCPHFSSFWMSFWPTQPHRFAKAPHPSTQETATPGSLSRCTGYAFGLEDGIGGTDAMSNSGQKNRHFLE